jgi:hypothetical protein
MASPRRFGKIRRLPSGRCQASYVGADGIRRPAPDTFERKGDADRWLSDVEAELRRGDWIDPDEGRRPLRDFAVPWVAERAGLRPKTRQLYEGLVRLHIVSTLGKLRPGRHHSGSGAHLARRAAETRVSVR